MRSNIKHVSFGLWGTLIKTNPRFKSERLRYLSDITGKSSKVVEATIEQAIGRGNSIPDVLGRYTRLLDGLGASILGEKGRRKVHDIYHDIEDLCLRYPPDIYDKDTYNMLQHLHKSKTIGIITNNTLFTAETTVKILDNMGLMEIVDDVIQSEKVKASKPDRAIFDAWVTSVSEGADKVYIDTYLHVGSSREKDFVTPNKLGMHSFLINGTTLRGIKSVNEYIKTYAH